MAKVAETEELEFENPDTQNDEETDLQNQLDDVFDGIGGDDTAQVRCKIYRIEGGLYQHLFDEVPGAMHNMEMRLRKEGGPGLYEVRIYVGRGIKRRIKVPIARTLRDDETPVVDNSMKPEQVLSVVQQMQNTQMEQFKLIMQNMISAQQQNRPAEQPPINPIELQSSMLAMMVQMKELLGPSAPPTNSDPIDTVSRVVEMIPTIQTLAGGEGGSAAAPMAMLAKEFLPKLMDMATLQAKQPPQAVAGGGLTPDQIAHMSNAHTTAVTSQPIAGSDPNAYPGKRYPMQPEQQQPDPQASREMQLNNFILNKALSFLLPAAERGFSTVTYAELLIDQATIYGMEQEVINYIVSDGSIDHMIQINPAVANYREWFEQVRQGVFEQVSEVPEPEMEANPAPDLTSAPITPINLADASIPTEPLATATDTQRGNGDPRNPAGNVESG